MCVGGCAYREREGDCAYLSIRNKISHIGFEVLTVVYIETLNEEKMRIAIQCVL